MNWYVEQKLVWNQIQYGIIFYNLLNLRLFFGYIELGCFVTARSLGEWLSGLQLYQTLRFFHSRSTLRAFVPRVRILPLTNCTMSVKVGNNIIQLNSFTRIYHTNEITEQKHYPGFSTTEIWNSSRDRNCAGNERFGG